MTTEAFTQAAIDYERIEKAIQFLTDNFHLQPNLKEIAGKIHVSEYHLILPTLSNLNVIILGQYCQST